MRCCISVLGVSGVVVVGGVFDVFVDIVEFVVIVCCFVWCSGWICCSCVVFVVSVVIVVFVVVLSLFCHC